MRIRKVIAVLATLVSALGIGFVSAGSASATGLPDCQGTYDVCLYFNSNAYGNGAFYEQPSGVNVSDYASKYFSSGANGSAGAGQTVKNHTASLDSWYYYRFELFFNSGYTGCNVACQIFPADATFVNLNANIKNNNASGKFLTS